MPDPLPSDDPAPRRHLEALELALQASGDGLWDWDLVRSTVVFSPALARWLGDAAGADGVETPVHTVGLRQRLHRDDRRATLAALREHLRRDGAPFDRVFRLRQAPGRFRWFHARGRTVRGADGRVLRSVGLLADVDERTRAEHALRASEQRLRTLSELSADWYWASDEQHRFTALDGGHQLPGGPPPPLLGARRWEAPSEGMTEQAWAEHRAQLERHEAFRNFEIRRRDEQGTLRVFLTSGRPCHDARGRFLGYEGVGRDVTELEAARQHQQQLQAKLREVNKMEALGTLAGGIAHDFNNVLGALMGTLKLAQQDAEAASAVTAHLAQMERSMHRARQLVQQILTFSRRREPELAQLELQPLVLEVLQMLRATLPPDVRLNTVLPAQPLHVRADAAQLHQALMNLCVNAWQTLDGRGGRVEVGLRETAGGDAVELWVHDDGPGMDAATRERAFEPFFTTKPMGRGTGLGLSVVHGVTSAHGGSVHIDSAPGQGCTVTLRLPRAAAPPETAPDREAVAAAAPAAMRPAHLLLVDDDEVMRLVSTEMLRRQGWRVSACASAEEAVLQLGSEGASVDMVITDFHMPGLSGLHLAQWCSKILPQVPLLMLSGHLDDDARLQARALGVRGFVRKEQIAEDLVRSVAEILGPAQEPSATAAPA